MVPTPILMEFFIMSKSFKRGEMGQVAIRVINENVGHHMGIVIPLMQEALGVNRGRALDFYKTHIKKGNCLQKEILPEPNATSKLRVASTKAPKAPKKALEASSGPKASKPSPDQVQAFKDGLERARVRAELKASVDTMVLDSQVA